LLPTNSVAAQNWKNGFKNYLIWHFSQTVGNFVFEAVIPHFSDISNYSWAQFHQHFMYKYFVRMSFQQLFLCNFETREKAAETTFVQKIRT